MKLRAWTLIGWMTAAALPFVGMRADAAQVSAQPHAGFERLSFNFDQPAHLSIGGSGSTIILHFDEPLQQSAGTFEGLLKGYASSASISDDGREVTITMNKAYRTRKFVSGTMVGVDIIGKPDGDTTQAPATDAPDAQEAPIAKPKSAPDILTTKKKPSAKADKASKAAAKKANAEVLTTKTAEPTPAPAVEEKKPEPAAETAPTPPQADSITKKSLAPDVMTTKKSDIPPATAEKSSETAAKTATADPVLTTKSPVAAAEPEKKLTPFAEANQPAPKPAPLTEPGKIKPHSDDAEAPPASTAPPAADGSFLVTVRANASGISIHFPYTERTAVAVFERGRDMWLIFSHPGDVNIARLRTVLPKSITDLAQYRYPGHTVLRLTSNGTLHASAHPIKNDYSWSVMLSAAPTPPSVDIAVNADSTETTSRLLLGAFDVGETVRFYDPIVGDLLLVIPTYESGNGIVTARHFPEFTLLNTNRGIAIASTRDDLTTTLSRLGVSIESPTGIAISKNLGVPGVHASITSGNSSAILLPYDQWRVAPDKFKETLLAKTQALRTATKESRADALLSLATLYLGAGMGAEANGYLDLLSTNDPDFYKEHKIALLSVAANVMQNHLDAAMEAIAAPELADVDEAELWREYLALFAPKANAIRQIQQAIEDKKITRPSVAAPVSMADDLENPADAAAAPATPPPVASADKPMMRFLKFNRPYIRFYPPRIRQHLAADAADAYIANGLEEKALAVYDTLNRDDILTPLRLHAEYALALVSIKGKKFAQAEEILKRIGKQSSDLQMQARARMALALLMMQREEKTPEETAETLESIHLTWRGDAMERDLLKTLAGIYKDTKHYDDALRTLKTFTSEFPGDSDFFTISSQMSDMFEDLYLNGKADEMPPLEALALFYEFRDLTPIGEKGDQIIQHLADRLAAFDLLDRAAQLLENQVNYRISGAERSRIGARLALIYILNHQPQEALKAIEVSNFGDNTPELKRERMELSAQALLGLRRYEDALNMISSDVTPGGELLKLDILWAAQDWPNVINRAEDILTRRPDLTATLTEGETEVLLKLALGCSFEGDYTQLRYLRDYYSSLLPDNGYKQVFDFITNDTNPLDREDSALLKEQINRTEGFLSTFKAKIAAGKLSEAVK